jgi:hypothetical protein
MSVQNRSILGPPNLPPSSGDGASNAKPSDEMNSRDAVAGLSATRDHEGDFRRAADASQGVDGSGAGGIAVGGSGGNAFHTIGNAPGTEFGTTAGGEDHLVQRVDISPDSNAQSSGEAI